MVTLPTGAFLFLRHGQTDANADDTICGSTDLALNATGLAQARQAADRLRHTAISRIIVSPLIRARQTAKAVADLLGLPLIVVEGLAERNWGDWEGQPRAILRRNETPPRGESPQAFADRTRAAFQTIALEKPTLIVAHSGTDRVLHDLLGDGPHHRLGNAMCRLWVPGTNEMPWICHEYFKNDR